MNIRHILYICIVSLPTVCSILLSKSSIETCTIQDQELSGGTCKQRILVSLAIHDSKGDTDALYANIHSIGTTNGNDQEQTTLKTPIRIKVTKTKVHLTYNLVYEQSVNGRPYEEVVKRFGLNLGDCRDQDHQRNTQCGFAKDKQNRRIPDSAGFCCRCHVAGQNIRRLHKCTTIQALTGRYSAHCLRMEKLYYDAYSIKPPVVEYAIHVKVEMGKEADRMDGMPYDWEEVETITINPKSDTIASKNGLVAKIHGDYAPISAIDTFEDRILFVPSPSQRRNTKREYSRAYRGGARSWLLIPVNKVDLSGLSCDRVGVSYTGFKNQISRCNYRNGSCLGNQLWDFYLESEKIRNALIKNEIHISEKDKGYFLAQICSIHRSTSVDRLRIKCEDLNTHTTRITLELEADDVTLVRNIASGVILKINSSEFEALTEFGRVTIEIENTGTLTSAFNIGLMCPEGLTNIRNKKVTLDASERRSIEFRVQSFVKEGKQYNCIAMLWDSAINTVDSIEFVISTNTTCACVTNCGCTCEGGNETECYESPIDLILEDSTEKWRNRVILLLLTLVAACRFDGLAVMIASCIIIPGCFKLAIGRVVCWKKSLKSELENQLKESGSQRDTRLFNCSGKCRGAIAAKKYIQDKQASFKKKGKLPTRILDWRAETFECTCYMDTEDMQIEKIFKYILTVIAAPFCCVICIGKRIRMCIS
ncbi:Protein HAPLESS 2-like [Oopsacas minuta]|uniref:Protein HAPLESS 2-like n=1 Tax=Oopsacas minuta TaxID=111878 RepID=A0AAV7JZT3_9METZ|nr:Protein HAPLESS 2-like [Oopsacas minuta]